MILDHSLEIFILDLMLLEGQIVDIYNEAIIALLDGRNHSRQQAELMLIDLDHAQTALKILIEHRLDAGGLARSAVTVQQHVVGALAFDEGLGVLLELSLLMLVADKIGQQNAIRVLHGQKFDALFALSDAEGAVHSQHSHAALAVVGGQVVEHFIGILGGGQLVTEFANMQTDVGVIQAVALGDGNVIGQDRKDICSQRLLP